MQLQFDANQSFQLEAVRAVVELFRGQPGPEHGAMAFESDSLGSLQLTETGIANRRVIADLQWLSNLHAVQALPGVALLYSNPRRCLANECCSPRLRLASVFVRLRSR